ncbi:hypothetical protein [Catelliglobosispora koreensis]|uniref:hypothetical protein n=1 Tax=Catelliglobosispora koreensis TaxID=129052 RepID=UPI000374A990|nr:hypothetical protein [Catelliglobosispora koreensis]
MTWDDKFREAADRVRAQEGAATHAQEHAAQQKVAIRRAQDQFIGKVTAEVIQPFLRAANSPAGQAMAFLVTRSEKKLFGGYRDVLVHRKWTIMMSHGDRPWHPREPWFPHADDRVTVLSTGPWFYEIVSRNPDMVPAGIGSRFTCLGMDHKMQSLVEGMMPQAGLDLDALYTRIEGSTLEYMAKNGFRPR